MERGKKNENEKQNIETQGHLDLLSRQQISKKRSMNNVSDRIYLARLMRGELRKMVHMRPKKKCLGRCWGCKNENRGKPFKAILTF